MILRLCVSVMVIVDVAGKKRKEGTSDQWIFVAACNKRRHVKEESSDQCIKHSIESTL